MEQRKPIKNDNEPIIDLVFQDLEERKAKGLETYGVLLQPFNGRNAIKDISDELLDAVIYTKQLEVERNAMVTLLHTLATNSAPGCFYDLKIKAREILKGIGEL